MSGLRKQWVRLPVPESDDYWYVVLEFNQASGRPRVYDDTVYDRRAEAEEVAERGAQAAKQVGRREQYSVFRLDEED